MQHDQKHAHERITGFGVCGKRNKELDQHPILCLTDLSLSQVNQQHLLRVRL
jgi:hypothetical protein